MADTPTTPIEIFRAGRHTDANGVVVEMSAADLTAIADAYDPTLGEAPFVIGHPKQDAPAYGWAKKLEARDGILFAEAQQIEPGFAELVNSGRFKKRSASFYLPNSPGNPRPGTTYLRHVGFLGAAVPAVTGLRDVSFAASDEGVVEFSEPMRWSVFSTLADVFRGLRDYLVESQGAERGEQLLPTWAIEEVRRAATPPDPVSAAEPQLSFAAPGEADITEPTMDQNTNPQTPAPTPAPAPVDFAAQEAALATREAAIAAQEAALAAERTKMLQAETLDFCAGLAKEGKLLPIDVPGMAQLLTSLTGQDAAPLEFAAADGAQVKTAPADLLRDFLSRQPKRVEFGEISGDTGPVDFASPQDLANRALEYQAERASAGQVISVSDAVHHLTKGSNA